MANHLDLEEQEQLDQLKHFWAQYGNWITWVLIVVLGGFASWNGFQYWQRTQAVQAAALYDEVERMALSADSDKTIRAFEEMKARFGSTVYAQQAGLLASKTAEVAGNSQASLTALTWVAEKGADKGYAGVAKLRLASALIAQKSYDLAEKALQGLDADFEPLAQDRRGDIYAIQGKKTEAIAAYKAAYGMFDGRSDYRRLVEVKLNALGVHVDATLSKTIVEAAK
ncbi:YfgM family protein [Rhodoferax aquaticus]|uniref:Tetratricopeptide repeat protein n=1 Tax=Rhodoferax aquaticus TaxID=2527691 RepID=A0A515EPX8_9BURK|nr:tetratricopeptide repeat protein [Rhodoferax aquaticus]QDL54731.1 tetratricopeptide repeat protein [Rhodoferax aquaticus]